MPKIVVISSVSPEPTSAGQIILYRHLNQATGWDVDIVPNPYQSKSNRWQTKLINRLEYTRFHRWGYDFQVIDRGRAWDETLINFQKQLFNDRSNQKVIVLTVAHGDGCWAAQRFAYRYQLPLVTIFHDWWPDIPALHSPLKKIIERRFQYLYQQSDLALCVSEGMRQHLGTHANSHVLYPIPAQLPKLIATQIEPMLDLACPFHLVYFGGLYDYGPMLGELLQATKDHSQIQVQVRGSRPNWPQSLQEEMRKRGLWLEFAPRDELNDWLASADGFLVTMSFEPALRRRMETSFSSKLPEYAQFGKPIIIWGSEYCSAIKWGLKGDRAVCVTDKDPKALVAAVEYLQQSPDLLKYYSQQSKIASQTEFNPVNLQQYFLEAISKLGEFETK